MKNIQGLVFLIFLWTAPLVSQQVLIVGTVLDSVTLEPIDLATVHVVGTASYTDTDQRGEFRLRVAKGVREVAVIRVGYQSTRIDIPESQNYVRLEVLLVSTLSDVDVTVSTSRLQERNEIRENTDALKLLPTASGNLESVLPHIALGARSGTGGELSSQYNVRGGNYDENLVYVNDFEIFRPQLIRNSQHEGLSFPNMDLIRDLTFSSGGYAARYGDKMSSVLDIHYKRPERMGGSIMASLLGVSAHLEGAKVLGKSNYQKLRYLLGVRYKTNRYLLGTLDTEGQYTPDFTDIQTYITYDFNKEWQLALMANYNLSDFMFTPLRRSTALGTFTTSLNLNSVFLGRESNSFTTGMVGTSLTYIPHNAANPSYFKLLVSGYRGREIEHTDITGLYRLSQVERDLMTGEDVELGVLGIGAQQEFVRNRLFNTFMNIELKGGVEYAGDKTHFVQWGVKFQQEEYDDRINEWSVIDSAGYSLPFSETEVLVDDVLKSSFQLISQKITAFVQDNIDWTTSNGGKVSLNLGARLSYWSVGNELTFSPRAQLSWLPSENARTSYRISGGWYQQTPFYRELRRPDGSVNDNLRSQQSIHIVGSMSHSFLWKQIGGRPFKFIMEAYYKDLSRLVSYDIDNVRIRYAGENDSRGYATGLDMRLNGEFVKGAESWVNVSWLRTRERIDGVKHLAYDKESRSFQQVSDVPRPTDQAFNISIFFQDYLPRNENIKVSLNLVYGTGIAFGLPKENQIIRNNFRFADYRRVDMGFSWQLWNEKNRNRKPNHMLRNFNNTWLTLEVFNIMGVENVSSNTWIKTIGNQYYAVPDKLTSRRLNLRFRLEF